MTVKAYVKNNVVIEIARVDPYAIFNPEYASQFIDAPDDVSPGYFYANNTFSAPPEAPSPTEEQIEQQNKNQNKAQAMQLLSATDWVTMSDVTTGSPKLTNQTEFLSYRSQIRMIAVNPTSNVTWPTIPTESWSN